MFKNRFMPAIGVAILAVCTTTRGSTDINSAIVVVPHDFKWEVAHAAPPGATLTVVEGGTAASGTLTMRMKFPANYEMPPHWHSEVERVTVISGSLNWGVGDKMDRSKTRYLPAGSIIVMPANLHHYAWTSEETVFQLNVLGPRTTTYVNAAEDPARKARSAAKTN
jgi:quercetin dioxygenase-like cupin family protein